MGLSDVGCVVAQEWQKTELIRSNVFLDKWIVMPDHVHGIVVINENDCDPVEAARRAASTEIASLIPLPCFRSGCLGAIIGRFKYACTKQIKSMGYTDFAWQTRFHDSILWDVDDINRVRKYIRLNPIRWDNKNIL